MFWSHIINKFVKKPKQRAFGESQIVHYYAQEGHKEIDGWLSDNTLSFIYYLDKFQNENNISGNIAEIGVYKGRFFIALCLLLKHGEKALAVDVFEDQQFNLDGSGKGDFNVFVANIHNKLGGSNNVKILKSDSKLINPQQLLNTVGGNFVRLFSVDGCHTAEHTKSDLQLASKSLVAGGVIILDDYDNLEWPGVREGTENFLYNNKLLIPFAVAYNKLYLTNTEYSSRYMAYIKEIVAGQTDQIEYRDVLGHNILNVLMPPPEKLFFHTFLQFIDFSASASPEKHLGIGWYSPEPWGVWSNGKHQAEVEIETDFNEHNEVYMVISFHAFVTENCPEKEIKIFINSKEVDNVIFRHGQDYINWKYLINPGGTVNHSHITISLSTNDSRSPWEHRISKDKRSLGVGLRNIRFYNKN